MIEPLKKWAWFWMPAALVLAVRLFLFAPFAVHGASMEPTFHDGERVFATKLASPTYGDVVIVHNEYEPGHTRIIKRVIGLAGDTIEVKDGMAYRNGKALDEPYIKEAMTEDFPPMLIPKGYLFVMGDNRNNSLDSRALGCIPEKDIIGTVAFRFWPLF